MLTFSGSYTADALIKIWSKMPYTCKIPRGVYQVYVLYIKMLGKKH